jgi:GTP cyclohydrolase I
MANVSSAAQRVERSITWDDVRRKLKPYDTKGLKLYGVPRGGLCALALLEHATVVTDPDEADYIVDDCVDSGATQERYEESHPGIPFAYLYHCGNEWLKFPWENENGPTDAVVRLIQHIGEDPTREGLLETPKRVVKAMRELTEGYGQDPKEILSKVFAEDSDEMVVINGIPYFSLCEHHMLPFLGTCTVAYLPNGGVIGLSKLPRLVNCFARRLQVQERLTTQIANAMATLIEPTPAGVAVIMSGRHTCMCMRGIKSEGMTTTSAMLGAFRDNPAARSELLALHTS